jgi:hypothetical protein
MRRSLLILIALVLAPAASAAGPWLGTATNGVAEFTATPHGTTTVVAWKGSQKLTLAGKWGLPRVTLNNDVGGLSADGRVLVLAQNDVVHESGALSTVTSFAVLAAKPLRLRDVVQIKGDFGFDTLSPHGRILYLIQHVSQENLSEYRVRAYDLLEHRLLPNVIADKRQKDWNMTGYPVGRASTADGHWVYTLYSNPNNYPFVHALDTVHRTAVCVGIPFEWATQSDQQEINQAALRIEGGDLAIGTRFLLDRATFKVTKRS